VQFPIQIELRRSRLLLPLLLAVHVLALASVAGLPWPWEIRALPVVAIGVSAVSALYDAARPAGILALRLSDKRGIACIVAGGDPVPATVLPGSTVFGCLIVLRVRMGETGGVTSLPLLPDSMSAEEFRALSLWLRWQAAAFAGKAV